MRLSSLPVTALLLCLPLMGCPPKEDAADTGEGDADTDTDTDADADADTDADTDADVTWPAQNLTGSVTASYVYDGATVCDFEADLTGTPYTGTCEGCDFAVAVTAAITRDDSSAECGYFPFSTFVQTGGITGLAMAHADPYLYAGYYYFDDAFLTLYSYEGYPDYYVVPMAYEYGGYPYGSTTFTLTSDAVSWSYAAEGADNFRYSYDYYCEEYAEYSYAEGSFAGTANEGSVYCDGTTTDVWTFVADAATANISVDTISADTTFDPQIWVNGADGCPITFADDNFECTFPPPAYSCPSAELTGLTAGETYEVVIRSAGFYTSGACTVTEVEYELSIDGGSDIALVTDEGVSGYMYSLDITGTGTITSAE